MGVFAGIIFDRVGNAAVRIAFSQNRVNGAAKYFGVAGLDFFFLFVFRFNRIVWNLEALILEFFDRGSQLRNRGRNIRKLDNIGFGPVGQFTEKSQIVAVALFFRQIFRKAGKNAACKRNVAQFEFNAAGAAKVSMMGRRETVARAGASSVWV